MPWSYNANDGVGTWNACKNELKTFRDAHASLVDFTCTTGIKEADKNTGERQGRRSLFSIIRPYSLPPGTKVKVFDMAGKQVRTQFSGVKNRFPSKGTFFYQLIDENGKIVTSGRFIVAQDF
jgi:hypothetical protein